MHLAGRADLQCAAMEEPTELSGWELVLDCALSELLSKLFPDNMHRMRPNSIFEVADDNRNHILHTCTTEEKKRNVKARSNGGKWKAR